MRACVLVVASSIAACGRTAPGDEPLSAGDEPGDASKEHDVGSLDLGAPDAGGIDSAARADSAPPDLGPLLACDGHTFVVELRGDAGVRSFASGCADAGSDAPLARRTGCGEDDFGLDCLSVMACDGRASVRLFGSRPSAAAGPWSTVAIEIDDGDGGAPVLTRGYGAMMLDQPLPYGTDPPDASLPRPLGGAFALEPMGGRFCVLYLGAIL